jgi:3-hydroxyacyl-CoA dehydrogenase
MIDRISNVVILGASGTVGSLVGGIFAQQNISVHFLSRTSQGAANGLKKAVKQARSEVIANNITCSDYDHLLKDAIKEADLIIESVSENLAIKKQLYELVDQYKRPDTIVGTTTSSLPLTELAKGRSENFRKTFLSTHFYNPPGKMLACEIAPQPDTDPKIFSFMKEFLEHKLRRVVIPVKNIAGFAGNRIAFLIFNRIASLATTYGVEMMDYLIGPYTGRAMAPLATLDLVGLDIHKAIIQSLYENTDDEMHHSLVLPDYIDTMIENGSLGNKTKGGFYKKLESGKFMFLDPATCDYIPAIKPHVAFVEKTKNFIHLGMYRQAFETICNTTKIEAEIVKDILCLYVSYSFSRVGEVTEEQDGIVEIDRVMASGFNWAPPSLIVHMIGGKNPTIKLLKEKGFAVPDSLCSFDESKNLGHNWGKYFIAR